MKNNLFRKFLALFLTGTMLTGVGCKDYDDDIDDLKGQIDDLKGKIELKADASALQTITDKLKDVNFSNFVTQTQLNEKLAGYVESSKLAGIIEAYGYQKKADVEKLISDAALSTADINALIKAQFTLANIWTTDVQKKVSDLISDALGKLDTSVSDADIATIKAAIVKSINEDKGVGSIHEAISKMVGDGFAGYMENYIKGNTDKWNGQVSDAVIAAFDAPNSELKDKILGLIPEIPEGPDYGDTKNATYLKTNDLTTVFAAYDAKISAIWAAIGDLAGRIQSIVFVPTHAFGIVDVNFGGSYIKASKAADNIALASSPKVKVAFRVAPAALAESLAGQINAGEVTAEFIPEEVDMYTRAEVPAPITYEGDVEAKDGKLIFTAVANEELYEALYKEDKTYSVALCLKQEAKKKENSEEYEHLGFEIVSPYISTSAASTEMNENFVLAKSEGEGDAQKLVAYKDAAVYPLVWNSTDAIKLLSDYVLAFKDGEEIISLDKAAAKYLWDEGVAEGLGYAYKHTSVSYTDASAEGVDFSKQTQLTVDPAKPTDKANVAKEITVKNNASKQNVANVGDVLEVLDKISITFGSKSIALNAPDVKSQVKVTGDMVAELTNIDVVADWKYATYSNGNTYSFVVTVPADKAMDWEAFNNLPASINATVAELPEDTKLILAADESAPTVTIARIRMASAESAQQFTVSVTNWLNGDGEVAFTAEPKVGATETFASISGKVTFKGLPAFTYEVKTEGAKVGDNYVVSYEKVNETLYKGFENYFADKAAVANFLKSLSLNYTSVAQAGSKPSVTPIVLPVAVTLAEGATLNLQFDGTNINWEKQPSYTYTVPTETGKGSIVSDDKAFEIKLTGSYTLTNANFSLKANDLSLKPGAAGKNPYIELNAGVNGDQVILNAIDLKRAYDMSKEASDAGAKVVYTLLKDANNDYKTYESVYAKGDASKWPLITEGSSSMSWQNFILSSCTIQAQLIDKNNKVCDTKKFDVTLVDPINFDTWNFFQGGEVILPAAGETAATFNIVNEVLAMSADGREPGKYTENNKPVTVVAVARDILGNAIYEKTAENNYALSTLATATNGYGFFYKKDGSADLFVEYGDLKWATSPVVGVTFDSKTGVITAAASNESVAATTATIDVTYRYRFAYQPVKDAKGKVTGYEMKPFKKTIKISFKK